MAAQFEREEGRLGPAAVLVDGAGDQLFAGAALALDQHGDVLAGDLADGLVDLAHGGAAAQDGAVHVRVRRGLSDDGRLAHPPGHLQRLVDHPPQLVLAERFEQVVVGAVLHRLDGRVGALDDRDEDHRDPRVEAADLLVDFQAGLVGQAEIEQNHVRRIGADILEPRSPGAGDLDPVSGSGERLAHLLLDQVRVIIDEQQMGHG